MKQNKTYQAGASHERQAILAYARRLARKFGMGSCNIADIIEWIERRTKRFDAKKGGLGRKRKAAK